MGLGDSEVATGWQVERLRFDDAKAASQRFARSRPGGASASGWFARPGLDVANHTMTHASRHRLSAAELAVEIVDAKAALEAMAGRPVRAFAFPWGNEGDATPAAMDFIRASDHKATFLMHGRRNTWRPAPDVWYRTLVQDQSGLGLAASVGLMPRLRSLRRATRRAVGRQAPVRVGSG